MESGSLPVVDVATTEQRRARSFPHVSAPSAVPSTRGARFLEFVVHGDEGTPLARDSHRERFATIHLH